jgi:hypothetical protein
MKLKDDSEREYIFIVDFDVPDELHELFNDYSLSQTHEKCQ